MITENTIYVVYAGGWMGDQLSLKMALTHAYHIAAIYTLNNDHHKHANHGICEWV